MIVAWLVFPALLAGLSLGVGLLAEAVSGRRLPGVLLIPLGLAGVIVAGQATASFDRTAELTSPLIVLLALCGAALAVRRRRRLKPALAPAIAFVLVGLVFSAPVIASGEPTFAGYIRLDDTATWLALTDRIMEHGRSLAGLAPSSYEATLAFNLGDGYPIGVFVPLGVGGELTGSDTAWLIQPYMSVLAGCLALVLFALAGRLAATPARRALIAAIAAQPALLVGYVQWGGVKEIAAAMLLALTVALAIRLASARARRRPRLYTRAALPPALAAATLIAVLSAGGLLWLAAPLLACLAIAWRRAGAAEALRRALSFAAITALLALPALATGAVLPPTSSPLTSDSARGNLFEPLEPAQFAGIWPAGDFRADPGALGATLALAVLVALAAAVGLVVAWRRGARAAVVYVVGTLVGCAAILALGSPWVDAKAMATAGPAVLIAALGGGVALLSARAPARRLAGAAAVTLIVGGVLLSNALAYRDANLAPYDQLAELERIGGMVAGEGPALMTEYQPYGVRHFLRDADAESVSELRRRPTPLRSGESVPKGVNADTDELRPSGLFVYPTLVLRRSPAQSRPPAPYQLRWTGEHYEVWQRPAGAAGEMAERLGLGDGLDPTGRADCGAVARLAATEPEGTVTAARRPGVVAVGLDDSRHLDAWGEGEGTVVPIGEGTVETSVELPRAGSWSAWLGGSIRGEVELSVDGRLVGEARHQLNNYGFFLDLGRASLAAGRQSVELHLSGADLDPGSGGRQEPIGPLLFSTSEPGDAALVTLPAARARQLCGKRWDWIEISP